MTKKIAVLRANAVGDFIFALPALQALRETFADAEIVLLGKSWHMQFLSGRPSPVDRVIVVPPYPGVGAEEDYVANTEMVNAFFERMQRERFDIAIQLHGGGQNSNPFIAKLGAALTIGLQADGAPPLDISIPYVRYFNEYLRYLEVVARVGARTSNIVPQLVVTGDDLREAAEVIRNSEHKPIVVMQPGASDPRRRWPVENFARVANTLADRGFMICLNGVPEEKDLTSGIIALMAHRRSSAVDLSGNISLSGLVGLLSKADLIISNDTGPLHLAHALQTPAVGIYWMVNMVTSPPMMSRCARPLISWNSRCPLCGTEFYRLNEQASCDHNASFVSGVTVESVLAAAEDLLRLKKQETVGEVVW
jgi:ADP-heptose:LPS heptosyltransferase